jgi:hypothetical protein
MVQNIGPITQIINRIILNLLKMILRVQGFEPFDRLRAMSLIEWESRIQVKNLPLPCSIEFS